MLTHENASAEDQPALPTDRSMKASTETHLHRRSVLGEAQIKNTIGDKPKIMRLKKNVRSACSTRMHEVGGSNPILEQTLLDTKYGQTQNAPAARTVKWPDVMRRGSKTVGGSEKNQDQHLPRQ